MCTPLSTRLFVQPGLPPLHKTVQRVMDRCTDQLVDQLVERLWIKYIWICHRCLVVQLTNMVVGCSMKQRQVCTPTKGQQCHLLLLKLGLPPLRQAADWFMD